MHAGFGIQIVDEQEAQETLDLVNTMTELVEEDQLATNRPRLTSGGRQPARSGIDFSAFRDPKLARELIERIRELVGDRTINLMEVCGTHTVSIGRYGFRSIMPAGLKLLSGPGCPVCVTANRDIDHAIALAKMDGAIITTFGDMMRVPGSSTSLAAQKAAGRDIRIVYSPLDALDIAEHNPDRPVIFMGVGFETTTPTIAAAILEADARGLQNFSVYCAHKTTPPALRAIANDPETTIDGFILPGHVATITGLAPLTFWSMSSRPQA